MAKSRSEMRKGSHKQPKKSRGLKIFLGIVVVLLAVFGLFIWKVYSDVTGTTDKIYKDVADKEEVRNKPVNVDKSEAFSILMLGVDTGDLGRTEQGRSDTIMVMTINPKTNESKIVSIPRDTYTEIVGKGTMDKINHAYAFGGTSMSMNTVQKLLNIPIDYYVEVNMQGIKDIVDAVGGIQVTSPLSFSIEGYTFAQGQTENLDGAAALAYSRMRYEDPNGDYGRQGRQRQVLEAIVKKAANFSTIANYQSVLGTMENNMQTDLAFADMVDIFSKYRSAAGNIEQVQLEGEGVMMNGVSYQQIAPEELNRVSTLLRQQLDLE